MKVMLLQDVPRVGQKYEVKDVAAGYARNFLIPREYALFADKHTLKSYEAKRSAYERERQIQHDLMVKNIEDLDNTTVTIRANANEQGHLFASIHNEDIVKAVKEHTNLDIAPEHVHIERPLKETGVHKVKIAADDRKSELKVIIAREGEDVASHEPAEAQSDEHETEAEEILEKTDEIREHQ